MYGLRAYRKIAGDKGDVIPTAKVLRGDVSLAVTAQGELRGGNPEMLTAPLTGGTDMHITTLQDDRRTGESRAMWWSQFDTTEQEYKLKEAEADLAEAQQKLVQAKAQKRGRGGRGPLRAVEGAGGRASWPSWRCARIRCCPR